MAPRFDVNAPDLYIPAMGFITYVLVAGLALGTQNKYTYIHTFINMIQDWKRHADLMFYDLLIIYLSGDC